ncbi:Zn(II)2Cys6 transcription factor [Aspergillus saccharolyticus JOP 1030-1]|uniref:C2H2 type zinc finger domain protein n=1 Tax=Aspergillus saccharolyticus JOP 1030-1 TaxID=1450539 RepID=A0A318ZCQ2_9EURO|nr:hypothetical protein BP01DRAFT_328100 [Aspergillus saccharolyticus JOP 1030-1]PYH41310.1 hypothetical protein BP01DRAFT_328100 [Aspergillus saccharolyticus JOP 1030-1]
MAPKTSYQCRFPRCIASYQRKEHRRRHEAQHTRQQLPRCPTCSQEFGRRDSLRRHMRAVHGLSESGPAVKHACTRCRTQKARCQGGPPCSNCLHRGIRCSLDSQLAQQPADSSTDTSLRMLPRPNASEVVTVAPFERDKHFLGLYFKLFHPHWSFNHRGSFHESAETPLLVQSMIALGMWVSGEKDAQSKAIEIHRVLDSAIRQQRHVWDVSASQNASMGICSWPVPTYQAILLHIIFAALHRDNTGPLSLDLQPSLDPAAAALLHWLVASCKKLGMLYYPNVLSRYCQDYPAAYIWVSIEEVKRFNLAVFKVCRTFGCSTGLHVSDLQFPLPENNPLWNAAGKAEWIAAGAENVLRDGLEDPSPREWISNSASDIMKALT